MKKIIKEKIDELLAILMEIKTSGESICWDLECNECFHNHTNCGNGIRNQIEEIFEEL